MSTHLCLDLISLFMSVAGNLLLLLTNYNGDVSRKNPIFLFCALGVRIIPSVSFVHIGLLSGCLHVLVEALQPRFLGR